MAESNRWAHASYMNASPLKKMTGIIFAIAIHVVVIKLLLSDRLAIPVEPVGQSVVVSVLPKERTTPAKLSSAALELKPISFAFTPPSLDLSLGKPEPPQPMVIIGAKFSPDVLLIVPIAQLSTELARLESVYRAQVSVQIFEDGQIGEAYIEMSDGDAVFDRLIASYVASHWHFEPALVDGVPSLSWKTVNVELTETVMTIRY